MKHTGLLRFLFGDGSEDTTENEPSKQETGDEYELIAVITAAVQEYMKTSPGMRLDVVSIKRTGQTAPVWSRVGRLDRISGKL